MNEKMKEVMLVMATAVIFILVSCLLTEIEKKNDLKIEAVERGYAQYTDGEWSWCDE